MRVVTGAVILLTLAARPALSSEAFITQVTNKTVAREQTAIAAAKSVISAGMLALPVKLNAAGLPVQAAVATPASNTSAIMQSGSNNFATVAQTGGGNASTMLQHGGGNQAVVTQRNAH
jgi:Curlin associated repeat